MRPYIIVLALLLSTTLSIVDARPAMASTASTRVASGSTSQPQPTLPSFTGGFRPSNSSSNPSSNSSSTSPPYPLFPFKLSPDQITSSIADVTAQCTSLQLDVPRHDGISKLSAATKSLVCSLQLIGLQIDLIAATTSVSQSSGPPGRERPTVATLPASYIPTIMPNPFTAAAPIVTPIAAPVSVFGSDRGAP